MTNSFTPALVPVATTVVEAVNHPKHYNHGNIEVIDFIEDQNLNFNTGNAVKYICRHLHKGTPVQDLEKALWYIQREIGRLKKLNNNSGGA